MNNVSFKPVGKKSDLVTLELEKELLVYDLKSNKSFCLNETLALIWNACNEADTICDIAAKLSRTSGFLISEEMVYLGLEQLERERLIENEIEKPTLLAALSRRELIMRAGLSSLAALPIITSIIAPTATQAASGCPATGKPVGCACTLNSQCSNSCCGTTVSGDQCVQIGLEPLGSSCRTNCECDSNSCPPAGAGQPRVCVA